MNIYYESDNYEKITQVAETSFSTLLANLGGQFGLFLGKNLESIILLIQIFANKSNLFRNISVEFIRIDWASILVNNLYLAKNISILMNKI